MKKLIPWILGAVLLMIGCPFLAVTFAGDAGMAVCFILFFAVNPLFSAACGIFSGLDSRKRWILPLLTALLFLAGVWLFFEVGEPAFLMYSVCYLVIGMLAMMITAFVKRKIKP